MISNFPHMIYVDFRTFEKHLFTSMQGFYSLAVFALADMRLC